MSDQLVIQSIRGPVNLPTGPTIFLPHERLASQTSAIPGPPLALQNIEYHRSYPENKENTEIGLSLVQHELRQLEDRGFIVDFSESLPGSVSTWLEGWHIIKGLPVLAGRSVLSPEDKAFYKAGQGLQMEIENGYTILKETAFVWVREEQLPVILELGLC